MADGGGNFVELKGALAEAQAHLRSHPDDHDVWKVLADALSEQGDPRGEVILLGIRIGAGSPEEEEAAHYARLWRDMRWNTAQLPYPPIAYRCRFEALFDELYLNDALEVTGTELLDPDPDLAVDPRWPDGMEALYRQVGGVDVDWVHHGAHGRVNGGLHIPPAWYAWSHEAQEGDLWIDDMPADHVFHALRPVDRFVAEACTVLYPCARPGGASVGDDSPTIHYHYRGKSLVDVGIDFRTWLEFLFRSRGVHYWIDQALQPPRTPSRDIAVVAGLFDDFLPEEMCEGLARREIECWGPDRVRT